MKYKMYTLGILLVCFVFISAGIAPVLAQDEDVSDPIAYTLFSNQKRPSPEFDHTLHEDSLGDDGCAKCHHILNEETKILIYSEGEEAACSECHTAQLDGDILALKEANHASCNKCHRQMKKQKKTTGPTTCGECHKK